MRIFVKYTDHVIMFKVREYSLRWPYGQEISHRNAYIKSMMKPLVKRPPEKHSKRWEANIRHCGQYGHWKLHGRPRFDSDRPRNSCLCQIFKKSAGARPASYSQGTGDYFSEERGWEAGTAVGTWNWQLTFVPWRDQNKAKLPKPLHMFLTSFYANKKKLLQFFPGWRWGLNYYDLV